MSTEAAALEERIRRLERRVRYLQLGFCVLMVALICLGLSHSDLSRTFAEYMSTHLPHK